MAELARFRDDFNRLSIPDATVEQLRRELAASNKAREDLFREGTKEIALRDAEITRLNAEIYRRGGVIDALRSTRFAA
jgi:hypothetical protein